VAVTRVHINVLINVLINVILPGQWLTGRRRNSHPVADCGLSADAGDPAGRAAGFRAPDSPAAGLIGCADGSPGTGVAPTALPKCATGG
jgi:hypothetical protein